MDSFDNNNFEDLVKNISDKITWYFTK